MVLTSTLLDGCVLALSCTIIYFCGFSQNVPIVMYLLAFSLSGITFCSAKVDHCMTLFPTYTFLSVIFHPNCLSKAPKMLITKYDRLFFLFFVAENSIHKRWKLAVIFLYILKRKASDAAISGPAVRLLFTVPAINVLRA